MVHSEFKNKKILILGGVRKMVDAVKTAQSMGIKVYVTDYLEDSPCKRIADKSFMVSATDADAVVSLIAQEKIDGVITGFVDSLLPAYVDICQKAGLPCYANKESLNVLLNKKTIKKACINHGIPVPHMYSQSEINDGVIKFPVIVKPVDSSGSRGCSVCEKKDQLKKAIEYALLFSKAGDYIIEDYISGDTLGMQFFVQNGELVTMFLSDIQTIHYYEDKPKICICQRQPSIYSKLFLSELYPKYLELFKSICVQNGPVQIDCYIQNNEIYWGDVGYRLCGDVAHYLVKEVFGVDFFELLISIALSGNVANYSIASRCNPFLFNKYAAQIEFVIKPGKVSKIIGMEKAMANESVFYSDIFVEEGFELKEEDRGKLVQVVGRTHLLSDSIDELKKDLFEVFNEVDFLDEKRKSLKIKSNTYWECIDMFHKKI